MDSGKIKCRVLIVDDEKLMRWSVGQALSDNNCEVELASSGEEAIEKAQQTKFDLIVSDLKMDGINGIETIKKIKKVSPQTKAIMITAYGTEKDAWDMRNEGIMVWITKPFQMHDLIRYVQCILSETSEGNSH